ncbi:hypothetical protein GCG54_00011956 [Colletotrichum gloeosporioides]|uniref:Uncharacterized protein n=1 Tax=Colletotrichum gloeosporioides TaxID=474922 RepID=A0A8H4FMC0_COLGL|nr:uncharacterized protein GCG54_00011956 [Colletotrichum gloeosporioides]KAF3807558.1 hypothetical protein GCG54_00011956 [Colletotrichum gloeosporioides]
MTDRLWGSCDTSITNGYDCSFPAMCYDSHACSTGCGRMGTATLTWQVILTLSETVLLYFESFPCTFSR